MHGSWNLRGKIFDVEVLLCCNSNCDVDGYFLNDDRNIAKLEEDLNIGMTQMKSKANGDGL